jgi:hypothetical protein
MDSAGLKRLLSGFVFELRSSFLETIRSERLSAGFSFSPIAPLVRPLKAWCKELLLI